MSSSSSSSSSGDSSSSSSSRKRHRSSSSSSSSSMDLVDDNVLAMVLHRIEDHYDRRAWCLVCKRFLRLESNARRRVHMVHPESLPWLLRRYTSLTHLDLQSCFINDESLALVATARLASINLSRAWGFTSGGLASLARICSPTLVDMDMSYCANLRDAHLLALSHLVNLRSLSLCGCSPTLTDIGLACLAAGCKHLRSLNLRGCLGITDLGLHLLVANCHRLHTLDLSYTEVTDRGLASVTALQSLQVLNLVSCNNLDDEGLLRLRSSKTSLVKLDVSKCLNVSDAGLTSLTSRHFALEQLALSYCPVITDKLLVTFQRLEHLQSIVLDGCEIAPNGLAFIARGCKQLKELSLSKCRGVTDQGIAAIAAVCTALHKLNLTCCRDLTNHSLRSISSSCTLLESLKMESCNLISEDGLRTLGDGCPRLEELDFTECNLNDTGLKYISKCSALRSLKLGFCSTISDKGAAYIGASCSNLRELDFYRSKGVGDIGIAAIAVGCPRLKVLDLSYCTRMTDSSLESLSRLRELHRLDLRGCTLVTSVGLAIMASGCKRLTELDIKKCSKIDNPGIWALSSCCPVLRMLNLSCCPVSDAGLMSLPKLGCLQTLRLVHLKDVTIDCFINVLTGCKALKNVKLPSYLRLLLPRKVIDEVEAHNCRIRWMEKHDHVDAQMPP